MNIYTRDDIALTTSTSMLAYYDAGVELGFTVDIIDPKRYIRLKKGKISFSFYMNTIPTNTQVGSKVSIHKYISKRLLLGAGVPAAQGKMFSDHNDAYEYSKTLSCFVIKPVNNYGGKGITVNPTGKAGFKKAFLNAQKGTLWPEQIIVEECLKGNDYRVLVAGKKVIGVTWRRPPYVTGDGTSTIKELIKKENKLREKQKKTKHIYLIPIDNELKKTIKARGYSLSTIPAKREKIILRSNGNISTGGISINYTDKIHPTMSKIAVKAVSAIGLDVGGVDLMVPDITKPYTTGGIIEINDTPGLGNHENPQKGKPQYVSRDIVKHVYRTLKKQS